MGLRRDLYAQVRNYVNSSNLELRDEIPFGIDPFWKEKAAKLPKLDALFLPKGDFPGILVCTEIHM